MSRRDAADSSLDFIRLALMAGCLADAGDPDDVVGLLFNIHHEEDHSPEWRCLGSAACPRGPDLAGPERARRQRQSPPLLRSLASSVLRKDPRAVAPPDGGSRCAAERPANPRDRSLWRRFLAGISRSFITSAPMTTCLAPKIGCSITDLDAPWPRLFILPSVFDSGSRNSGCSRRTSRGLTEDITATTTGHAK
jgi:hypothetical protein